MYCDQLKEGQVLIIEDHLKSKGIFYQPIFYELVDHICIIVGTKMKDGMPFIDAFERAKEEFGRDGLERIYIQTIYSLKPMTRFKNYFKSAWRNILRQRVYTVINLIGLILGIAVSITIGIYVNDELSFDTFHPDRVYRVSTHVIANGQEYNEASSQFPLAEAVRNDITGVKAAFNMHKPYSVPLLRNKDIKFAEDQLYFVDKTFFDVFGYPLIEGDKATALTQPNSILLTKEAANRYFGNADPIGKIIEFVNGEDVRPLTVTGIVKNMNERSHFKFEVLVPIDFLYNYWDERFGDGGPQDEWFWTGAWTYIKLEREKKSFEIKKQFPSIVKKYFPDKWKDQSVLNLDKIDDIHLGSDKIAELEPNGSIAQIKIFSTIGLVVLLIAIINFINLMSAQGFNYAKQVGVRKFLGAVRLDIVQLYLIESILLCLIAGILAIVLMLFILLPEVNIITGKALSITNYLTPGFGLLFIMGLIFIGIIAGLYPSLSLARLESLKILSGTFRFDKSGAFIRQSFVVFQFIASVVLIISVIIINTQNNFIQDMDTGFDKNNILVVQATGTINDRSEAFKNEVRKISGVKGISGVLDIPGRGTASLRFIPEGRPDDQPEQLPLTYTDHDLIEVSGLELASGRFFDRSQITDPDKSFILNEKATNLFGWTNEEAIGKNMKMFAPGSSEIGREGKVIGIVKNYNFESIHNPIRPLVIVMHKNLDYYLVKFGGVDVGTLTENIRSVWGNFDSSRPMESYLMDQNLAELYDREQKLSLTTNYGMGFALVIALIGIYGLSSFLLARRTKEVGVRRVLGSNQSNLMFILSRDFIGLIFIANLLAWPIAYILMSSWLENFVYHIDLSWTAFVVATATSLVLAILAIGYHVLKISRTDPITSLRYE